MLQLPDDGTLRDGLQQERQEQRERRGRKQGIRQRQGQDDERRREARMR